MVFQPESVNETQYLGTSTRDILLEYSNDGGIEWTLIQILRYRRVRHNLPKAYHVALPTQAQTPATRLRWSQPGGPHKIDRPDADGWMIDEVFLGGEHEQYTLARLEEDFSGDRKSLQQNWLLITGAALEPSCDSKEPTLHFKCTFFKGFIHKKCSVLIFKSDPFKCVSSTSHFFYYWKKTKLVILFNFILHGTFTRIILKFASLLYVFIEDVEDLHFKWFEYMKLSNFYFRGK